MKEESTGYQATDEQIQEWKKKHGDVFALEVTDEKDGSIKRAYVHKPKRQDLDYAMTVGKTPLKFNEVILNRCWIEGDEIIKTDDDLFFGVSGQLEQLIPAAEATIKKL